MANLTSPHTLKNLYDVAFECIKDAKKYKQQNQLNLAHDLYIKSIEHFMQIIRIERDIKKKETIKKYVTEFINDAEALQQQIKSNFQPSAPTFDELPAAVNDLNGLDLPDPPSVNIALDLPDPPDSNDGEGIGKADIDIFEQAQIYLDEAIEFDQHKQHNDALTKYKIASQLFLDGIKQKNLILAKENKTKYRNKVMIIVGRCEILNALIKKSKQRPNTGLANEPLSAKEIRVLRSSSFIRNLELLPWMDSDSNNINYSSNDELFKDPSGLLPLSQKQKNKFGKWKRIKNISSGKPCIVSLVTPYSITQTLISDCSFVSSLTVTALYEKVFRKQLITSIIYPQKNNVPSYNSNGKYAVKLYINGCYRKVTIDDYLPVSAGGKLLCSYSNNVNEFWVSLIEKAFLKVMGGYDFPGSTSAEDLCVLTGWIPERIGLQSDEIDSLFNRLVSGHSLGDCLITLSSAKMSEEDADVLGLVPTHAYAVLRVEKLGNWKFMLIKNPWAEKRWKGRFSAQDDTNWTPQLRKALNYNPNKEKQFDNGIFWMCLQDIFKYFSAVFLNWNPKLFKYKITQHGFWSKKIGPKNDSYNLGYNPQFTLDVEVKDNEKKEEKEEKKKEDNFDNITGCVWILLSKHMESSKRQEQDKNDFLTLHVYDESTVNTRDRRVFHRKGALHTGTYINSPHYLMRIEIPMNKKEKKNIQRYTIIISQYEKKHDVAFTITAYSTLPARFKPIDDVKLWKYQKVFNGLWTAKYSGGSPNHDTFPLNPQFKITTFFKTHLRFLLEAPIEFSINIQLYLCINDDDDNDDNEEEQKEGAVSNYDDENIDLDNNEDDNNNPDEDENDNKAKGGKILSRKDYSKDLLIGDSGPYRYGVTMLDVLNIEPGTYIGIISTFKPSQCGGFKFTVKSVENLQLKVV